MLSLPEGMKPRPTWDEYFFKIAEVAALRSTCTRRQVGAVLVDWDTKMVLGLGYNGAPPGEPHCTDGACPRGLKSYDEVPAFSNYDNCIAVHAEVNALRAAPGSGNIMFITCQPCEDCHILLVKNGIDPVWRT